MLRNATRFLALGLLALALPVCAQLNVVATTPSLGMLAREVAGPGHRVKVLTTPQQNVHHVQARPSIMAALRSADLLLAVGADLEVAWLGPALMGSANPRLRPTRPGYFEATTVVTLIDVGKPADRRLGDVHPHGNPHVTLDPVRMGDIAMALARRLAELDPGNAAGFSARAASLRTRLAAAADDLRSQVPEGIAAILFHADADYLMRRLDVDVIGYVEPLPGIPPTASHIAQLAGKLDESRGVIFHAPYHPAAGPERLAQAQGWRATMLPIEPPVEARLDDYLALLQRYVDALTGSS